jgi:hypothetical protein
VRAGRLLPALAVAVLLSGCTPAPGARTVGSPGVWELDPYSAGAGQVERLHQGGGRVLCRLSLGGDQPGRPDFDRLPAAVRGAAGPDGGYWLDVRRLDVLLPVLGDRLRLCRQKGFDAVDGYALDAYRWASGFPLDQADQLAFDRAVLALARGLRLGAALRVPAADARALAGELDVVDSASRPPGAVAAAVDGAAALAALGPAYVAVVTEPPPGTGVSAPPPAAPVTGAAPDAGAPAGSGGRRTRSGS